MEEKQAIENVFPVPVPETLRDTNGTPFSQTNLNLLQRTNNGIQPLTGNVSSSHQEQSQSAGTMEPFPEKNGKHETKKAKNTVTGIDILKKPGGFHTVPVAASSDDNHEDNLLTPSLRAEHTFVPAKDHSSKVKKLESQMKSVESQKQLEADENEELKQDIEELHEQRSKLQTQTSEKLEELHGLNEDRRASDEKLKTIKESKRQYARQAKLTEDYLRVAKEEIEDFRRENEDLKKQVKVLFLRLDEETRQRKALEVKVDKLEAIITKNISI